MSDYDRSDVNRLLRVLRHQEADRLPHIELWVTSQAVYESVLERQLDSGLLIRPRMFMEIFPTA